MTGARGVKLDEVGYWSEVKLEIVRDYAKAYSTVLNMQASIQSHLYIDAFAGAGVHISKATGRFIPGSPLNALNVQPPFKQYHLIDLDGGKADSLRKLAGKRTDVFVYEADCNKVLLEEVFPRCRYADCRRALCLLDPYGLHIDWEVIHAAGRMRSVEIFLNFPVMDMNMNVLWRDPGKVQARQVARMDAFWGDRSWRNAAYVTTPGLFGEIEEKAESQAVADAFRQRLTKVAGFAFVPEPLPMRNTRGAIVYYLFFASPNKTGHKIVTDIFIKWRKKGVV